MVEKLARRVIGLGRAAAPASRSPYPYDAPRGPVVALADEHSGSDGDIVTAAIKRLGIGPVVGTRTWGGVIGIDGRYRLVDGTWVTQPRYASWFDDTGWEVENHGVDPDVEVVITPQDWAAGPRPAAGTRGGPGAGARWRSTRRPVPRTSRPARPGGGRSCRRDGRSQLVGTNSLTPAAPSALSLS